jgi:uncharacterized protein YndB with AHSA1/START domain
MTWTYQHSVETSASADDVWRHWSDMERWPQWNDGIRAIEVDGLFAVGTTFRMTSPDGDQVQLRLTDVVPGRAFTDEMDGGDFQVRTLHQVEPLAGGYTRVTYRTDIVGAAADQVGPELGPAITADFPEVLASLVALAEANAEAKGP